jgi:hypothetical protein
MPTLNDSHIDELADARGRFFGRAPVRGWPKPISVSFHRSSLREVLGDVLEGKPAVHQLGPTDMDFEIQAPWATHGSSAGHVRPRRSIFEDFLSLGAASDAAINAFASRFGPLLIYCRVERVPTTDHLIIHENSEVWRYFARCMKSFLRIAAAVHSGRSSDPSDWDIIGNTPFPIQAYKGRRDELEARPRTDLLREDYPFETEELWRAAAAFVRRGQERNREMWTRLLNALIEFGRTRPSIIWDGTGNTAKPRMVFSGPYLLSYLTLQLCLTAMKQDAFVVCSYCRQEYSSIRAPKAGQRNFCPDCRKTGVPVRVAQRTHRERLRKS